MAYPAAAHISPHQSGRSTPSTLSSPGIYSSQNGPPYGAGQQAVVPTGQKRARNNERRGGDTPKSGPSRRSSASHGKLHRRDGTRTPVSSAAQQSEASTDQSNMADMPAVISNDEYYTSLTANPNKKPNIKSLVRKLTPRENSLDLSRSAAENEGLGIYTYSNNVRDHRRDLGALHGESRMILHTRTTSGTSQASAMSAPANGSAYVHPMRQTPRPYTPPTARSHSHQASLAGSEASSNRPGPTSDEPFAVPHASLPSYSNRSTYSGTYAQAVPRPNASLTSVNTAAVPGTPSSLRYADTFSPTADTVPTTTRSSLESTFRFRSRSRSNTNATTDLASQMATVQALRAKFNEEEAAKEAKYREKEARRRERQEESTRRKSETRERKRARSNAASERSAVSAIPSIEYSATHPHPFDAELEAARRQVREEKSIYGPNGLKRLETAASAEKAHEAVSSQWSLFWFSVKTMWLRLKRSMGGKRR